MTITALSFAVVVTGVGACIQEQLEATPESGGVPTGMRLCFLVPGNIAWDSCKCGQLALTIVNVFPTVTFPQDSSSLPTRGKCGDTSLGVSVLASLTRCVPTMNSSGVPPSCAALMQAALIQQGDQFAMRNGIECCLYEMRRARTIVDFRVGAAIFPGPEGACGGVEIPFSFQMV